MRHCILWVEDNASDVTLVRQAIADIGLDVELIVAPNAVLAFKYMDAREPFVLSRNPPDLILIDLNLPGINGLVVLSELRSHHAWKAVPNVVLTSSNNAKELAACKSLGAVDCITKPATFEGYLDVLEHIRRYLPGSGGHPTDPQDKANRRKTRNRDPKSEITNAKLDELAKPDSSGSASAAG